MEAVLKVYAVIGTNEGEFSSRELINFLDENKDASGITVRIKSPGGSVREGWTMYDKLKESGKRIKTIAEGELYSIATVLFLAGQEREILPNADGLIHMPRIPNPEGDFQAADLREMAEYMDKEEEKILNLYVQVTGQDKELLREYMTKETMLSADDMLKLGFATKIDEPLKAVAYFNYNLNKMENSEFKTFTEKLDTIAESVKALFSRIAKDQTLKDKDGKEFKIDKETGDPTVGDSASPDGTFTMANGRTIVIAGGKITEVKEPTVGKSELELANEKIADLTAKLAKAESEKVDSEKIKQEAETEKTKASDLVKELQNMKNLWIPEGRTKFSSGEKVGDVNLNRVRELNEKINAKKE